VPDAPQRRPLRVSSRQLLLGLLGLSLLVLLAAGGLWLKRSRTEVPQPGQLALLDPALLRRTLIARGVPPAEVVDPFESSPALQSLGRAVAGKSEEERVRALARRVAGELGPARGDLQGALVQTVRTPRDLYSELKAGKVRAVLSFEFAALMVTVLREAGLSAVLGVARRLDAPVRSPDLNGAIGRYLAVVYPRGKFGQKTLAVLDPLRALDLPAWAGGGKDPEMRSLADGITPLDDASAAAHLLALRALHLARDKPEAAYAASLLSLKAAAPSAALHVLRAEILASAGGIDDALSEARRALAVVDDAPRRSALARLEALSGHGAEAVTDLEQALQRDASYWPANEALAALLLGVERERGEKHLQAALEVAPEEPSLLVLQGVLWLQQNKPKDAAAVLQRALAQRPTPQASLLLYQALTLAGEREEAGKLRQRLLAQDGKRKEMEQALQAIDRAQSSEDAEPSETAPPPAPRIPKLTLPDASLRK
jgi:tetratricopeptide (TPR) repeat protein